MFCQNCGTQLGEGVATCYQCGRPPLRSMAAPLAPMGNIADDPAMRLLLPVGQSIWAVLAGYAGLFAVLGICAPFALILGCIALWDLKKHPEKHGKGRAIFAIVMGILGLFVPVMIVLVAMYSEK